MQSVASAVGANLEEQSRVTILVCNNIAAKRMLDPPPFKKLRLQFLAHNVGNKF